MQCLTFFMALLLVFGPLARLVLIRVAVDSVIHSLGHLLLPALRDHQRKVLIELLITVKQLRETQKDDNDIQFRQSLSVYMGSLSESKLQCGPDFLL